MNHHRNEHFCPRRVRLLNRDHVINMRDPFLFNTNSRSNRFTVINGRLLQVPVTSIIVDGNPALNRVKWMPSGLNLTVGDDNGKIWVYEVGEVCIHNQVSYHNVIC